MADVEPKSHMYGPLLDRINTAYTNNFREQGAPSIFDMRTLIGHMAISLFAPYSEQEIIGKNTKKTVGVALAVANRFAPSHLAGILGFSKAIDGKLTLETHARQPGHSATVCGGVELDGDEDITTYTYDQATDRLITRTSKTGNNPGFERIVLARFCLRLGQIERARRPNSVFEDKTSRAIAAAHADPPFITPILVEAFNDSASKVRDLTPQYVPPQLPETDYF